MIIGVVSVTQFPHGATADFDASVPEAVPALLRCLSPGQEYRVVIRGDLWEEAELALPGAVLISESVDMSISPEDLRIYSGACEVRRLSLADEALTNAFPPPESSPHEPPLSVFLKEAEKNPRESALFAAIRDGEIVSFVQFSRAIDNIWDQHIRTRDDCRRRGFGKAVLSYATSQLLQQGIVPLYDVNAANTASLRTAAAVGYRQFCRRMAVRCVLSEPFPSA